MTRIPINKSFDVSREDYARGTRFFPTVGLIIGLIVCVSTYLVSFIFSPLVSSLIGLIVSVIVTGGIHLDGFSDTCDGIFSGRSREKILEIMKDSRLGTFGGISLILILLSRYIIYYDIILNTNFIINGFNIVLLAPIVSRAIVVFFAYNRKYAREDTGLGDLFVGKVNLKDILINQLSLVLFISIINYKIIIIYIIVLIFMIIVRRHIEKILNGITGDILGFSIEISEILFMLIALGMVKYL